MGHRDQDKIKAIEEGYNEYLASNFEETPKEQSSEGFRWAMKNILHAPREERRERLLALRAKVEYFEKAWDQIVSKIVSYIQDDPDMSEDDFDYLLDGLVDKAFKDQSYGPLHDEIQRAKNRTTRSFVFYQIMRDRASSLICGTGNPYELFEKVFGVKPLGRVEIKEGLAHVHFDCHEELDFMIADHGGPLTVREADSYAQNNVSGSKFSVDVPNYGTVIFTATNHAVLKGDPSTIGDIVYTHEEQHVLTDIFENGIDAMPYDDHDARELYEVLCEEDILGLHRILDDLMLKFRRTQIDIRTKSEILSFFKEKMDYSAIYHELTNPKAKGGIYDYASPYLNDPRLLMEEMLGTHAFEFKQYTAFESYFKEAAERWLEEDYKNMISRSLKLIQYLHETLDYDEIITHLSKEPIHRWGVVAKRIG